MTDSERLARLETWSESHDAISKERWDNHDKRSDERLDDIKGSVSRIELRLDKLHCIKHQELLKEHTNFISAAMKVLWLFVAVSVATLVKAFWK